jgi:hypothetical protein
MPLLLLLFALAGCDALPRDPAGTSQRVQATRTLRVGVEAGIGAAALARAFLSALAAESGAAPRPTTAATEPMLQALEAGELDLVLAWFDAKTPWETRVALGPPLAERGEGAHRQMLRAAARSGENRWIVRLERVARRLNGGES